MKQSTNSYLRIFFLYTIFLLSHTNYALVVGSNTAVLRQGTTFFPNSDFDNTMLGFVAMQNGFILQDNTTTVTFDAFFPMAGEIDLNGGNLYLTQDLMADNVTTLTSLGNIYGATHQLSLSSYLTSLGSSDQGLYVLNNTELLLNNDVTFNGNFLCQGNCIINGNGNILSLSSTASFLVDSNGSLEFKNIVLSGMQDTNISCIDDTGVVILNNTTGIVTSNFTFSLGNISINNCVTMKGVSSFIYESSQTSTINQNSMLHITQGATLEIGNYQPNWPVPPLAFVDQTSILALENCTLDINSNGLPIIVGKVQIIRDVTVDINSTSTANGLILGDRTAADDPVFEFFPSASLTYNGGHVLFNVTQANVIRSLSAGSRTIRTNGNTFYINQNLTISNVTLQEDETDITLIAPGNTLTYSNLTAILPFGAFQANATQTAAGAILLSNGGSIVMLSGFFVLPTIVIGSGSSILGNGIYAAPIILENSNANLMWSLNGPLAYSMTMNGGSLTLEGDMQLGNSVILSGAATVHLNGNDFVLGQQPVTWADPVYWDGSNDGVILNASLALDTTWTFSGQCILNGNGRVIDFANGTLLIERGSSLVIKNAILKNISGSNIQCLDDAAILTLDNVTWLQDENFTFTVGSMQIANNTTFRGAGTFAYQTSETLTILSQSSLTLDQGFTFSYDPIQNQSTNLIVFTDSTAQLNVTRSTLHATMPGLKLMIGSMFVHGLSFFSSEIQIINGVTVDNGITLGDGMSLANDFICDITAAAILQVTQGSLNYQNLDSNSWIMENINSILYMFDATTLRLYNAFNLGIGAAQFGNNAVLARANTGQITGTVVPLNQLIYDSI